MSANLRQYPGGTCGHEDIDTRLGALEFTNQKLYNTSRWESVWKQPEHRSKTESSIFAPEAGSWRSTIRNRPGMVSFFVCTLQIAYPGGSTGPSQGNKKNRYAKQITDGIYQKEDAAMPRKVSPTKLRKLPGPAIPPGMIKFPKSDIDAVVTEAAKTVADRMGIPVSKLPAEVMEAIKSASPAALSARTQTLIQRDVESAVKETVLSGVKPVDMLDARVAAARTGIQHLAANAEVDAVLADTATLLWKKFQALKTAGFTETQAYDLLLAEVQGRSSRSR